VMVSSLITSLEIYSTKEQILKHSIKYEIIVAIQSNMKWLV
jgi:hypothetical protein